jgi:hypothetical protein
VFLRSKILALLYGGLAVQAYALTVSHAHDCKSRDALSHDQREWPREAERLVGESLLLLHLRRRPALRCGIPRRSTLLLW